MEKGKKTAYSKESKHFIDNLIYAGGILGPLFTIPQFSKIWMDKNAAGVSAVSWAAYLAGALFWLMYGIIHKEKPIIFVYGIWFFLDLSIVIGTFIYS